MAAGGCKKLLHRSANPRGRKRLRTRRCRVRMSIAAPWRKAWEAIPHASAAGVPTATKSLRRPARNLA
eukprot:7430254-Pyramimonas_sp.AAC.1